jgi:hypothetical protein
VSEKNQSLTNFSEEGKAEPIIAKISQETLAEIVRTSRSGVSASINKFGGGDPSIVTAACEFTNHC